MLFIESVREATSPTHECLQSRRLIANSTAIALYCSTYLEINAYMAIDRLQLVCTLLGVAITIGNAQERVIARPMSMLGAILSSLIYYPAGLYAKCLLNVVVFVLNAYGWYQWSYGGKDETPLKISRTSPVTLLYVFLACVGSTVLLGSLLYQYSRADVPYWDSLHTTLYLIGQWMLVHKKLESWALCIAADILYVGVLHHKALYLFSGLHVFYTILAIYGYYVWYRVCHEQVDGAVSHPPRNVTEL